MRLWSLHPKYLDRQGLLAVWREGLLAQAVLAGKTRGYHNHPQLSRFRSHLDPIGAIGFYLSRVHLEAICREYRFDAGKIARTVDDLPKIPVKRGQIDYEWQHLQKKLQQRSPMDHERWKNFREIEPHPLFAIVAGGIEDWERA